MKKPPQHAYEVTVQIGGNDWEYVLRTMDELTDYLREHGPNCSVISGSWGGCHSVHIQHRDVSPDQYRSELDQYCLSEEKQDV
jgi:hypothetical protein